MRLVGWHHQLNGHESEHTPGDGEGQGSLACCSPWIAKSLTQLSDQPTKYKQPQHYLREHSLGLKHIICCRKGQLWKFIIRRKLRTIFNWGVTEELLNSHPKVPQASICNNHQTLLRIHRACERGSTSSWRKKLCLWQTGVIARSCISCEWAAKPWQLEPRDVWGHPRWHAALTASERPFTHRRRIPTEEEKGSWQTTSQGCLGCFSIPPSLLGTFSGSELGWGEDGFTMGLSTKGPPPFQSLSFFSSWAQLYANNALKEAQNTGYWMAEEEQGGGANSSKSGSRPVKWGLHEREAADNPGFYPTGSKVKHLPAGPLP